MTRPCDLESIVTKLNDADVSDNGKVQYIEQLFADLDIVLQSDDGVNRLKQQIKPFETILSFFIKVIFCRNNEIAQAGFKYFNIILEIFRSKLPKIKKGDWWKKFELDDLVKSIRLLSEKITPTDDSWVEIWRFVANIIISDGPLSPLPLNTLLSISEAAFKKGKEQPLILDQAWKCWIALIDAFGRSPKILLPSKITNLLLKPLVACHSASKFRISTWIHLIKTKGLPSDDATLKQLVDPFCKAMYKSPGDKAISRHLPEECAESLTVLLTFDQVVKCSLTDIINVFEACLNSRPSVSVIEKLCSELLGIVNSCKDSSLSYNYWKTLVEQYKTCSDSPILKQACHILFTGVKFQRWVDSGEIVGKDVLDFMSIPEFRSEVLGRSIVSSSPDENNENNTPKKRGKQMSFENIWNIYCEAYVSWLINQYPAINSKDKDSHSPECPNFSQDGYDFLSMQALLLLPLQKNIWCPSTFKTWTMLCETYHKYHFLHSMIKLIYDTFDDQSFQIQKALDVLNLLCGLDSSFCKQGSKLLEKLGARVHLMDAKHVMDLLNILEIITPFNEMTSIIGKTLKTVNEKCSDYDQLNVHRMRTKVGKISRKMDQLTNSAEKEKPVKAQRTPFRTQSNFLQRLAKAEEKNKTKNVFLSSIFSGNEKNKTVGDEDAESSVVEETAQDITQESVAVDVPLKTQEASENTVLISPPALKDSIGSLATESAITDCEIVAEKENVIIHSSGASPVVPSPASKLKITNARELKMSDSQSPTIKKLKPIAGQKLTPKKLTPSKVSYFDDDASDCVMVPPKPKTTPLTEHQMEIMTKRRADIPALYQDLSQDTQQSNNPQCVVVREIVNDNSNIPITESEEIVQATPSPLALVTPERPKNEVKTCTSAKKLDFNSLIHSPATKNHSEIIEDCTTTVDLNSTSTKNTNEKRSDEVSVSVVEVKKNGLHTDSLLGEDGMVDESKNDVPSNCDEIGLIDNDNEPITILVEKPLEKYIIDVSSKGGLDTEKAIGAEASLPTLKTEQHALDGEDKHKRKRKSEPVRFSPKLTRSKRNVKGNSSGSKHSQSLCVESTVKTSPNNSKFEEIKEPNKKDDFDLNEIAESISDKQNKNILESADTCISTVTPLIEKMVGVDDSEPTSNTITNETPKKIGTKRKCDGLPLHDSSKKIKIEDDLNNSVTKKGNSSKKKKKPFRTVSTNNKLESWLLKTERNTSSSNESILPDSIKENLNGCEDGITELPAEEAIQQDETTLLDYSDEIVPSTQDLEIDAPTKMSIAAECKLADDLSPDEESAEMECENIEKTCSSPEIIFNTSEMPLAVSPENEIDLNLVPVDLPPDTQHIVPLDSSESDEIDLIISSPSKRYRRATSVLRGEGDTYLSKDNDTPDRPDEPVDDESLKRSLRNRTRSMSPSQQLKKRSFATGGRSAKMLRLAASSCIQEDENVSSVTPTRKRRSIAPVTYGENWPKGQTEDWVAFFPSSPFTSPYKSALKKRPPVVGEDECMTPINKLNETLASPLTSSARRKRVGFLDPPVTTGLIYQRDSPFGAIHLADVPRGSPYPTWKHDEKPLVNSPTVSEVSTTPENIPTKEEIDVICQTLDLPVVPIDETNSSHSAESSVQLNPMTEWIEFKNKYRLDDEFMESFFQINPPVQQLLKKCFESNDMVNTVDSFKLSEYREISQLPRKLLSSVNNCNEESLIVVLKEVNVKIISTDDTATKLTDVEVQTSSTVTVPNLHSASQTDLSYFATQTVGTNSDAPPVMDASIQADQTLPLPVDELASVLKDLGLRKALEYFSDSLRVLSTQLDA